MKMEKNRSDKIITERLILRAAAASDLADIYEYVSDPQVAAQGGFSCCPTQAAAMKFLKRLTGPTNWVIEEKKQLKVIGNISLSETITKQHEADPSQQLLGYTLNAKFKNQGYMTEAVAAILQWARFYQIKEVQAVVAWENIASQRVLEKNGFALQGIFEAPWGSQLTIKKFGFLKKIIK